MDIRFLETSIAGSAIVTRPFQLPVLRSLLDEHHFGTINRIWLQLHTDLLEHKITKPIQRICK